MLALQCGTQRTSSSTLCSLCGEQEVRFFRKTGDLPSPHIFEGDVRVKTLEMKQCKHCEIHNENVVVAQSKHCEV